MTSKRPDTGPTHGWGKVEDLKKAEESMRGDVPKPYSVPEGYVPPTMMEQWRYARRRFVGLRPLLISSDASHAFCDSAHSWEPLKPGRVCKQTNGQTSCAGIPTRSTAMDWCLSWGWVSMQRTLSARQGSVLKSNHAAASMQPHLPRLLPAERCPI